jgi:hypothetical protein
MTRWGIRYGSWWAVQWVIDGWLSFGIHIDFKRRRDQQGRRYAPYIDLHLGIVILSFGVNPALSGDLEKAISVGRGGLVE